MVQTVNSLRKTVPFPQKIFFFLAVLPSAELGLVAPGSLTLSGDGTAVVPHASPYGKHLSSCGHSCPYRDNCGRHYSDPDADWGWDSSSKAWYFGHPLYMLCCRNNTLKIELPLLMKFTSAKRHDSINFLYAIDDFGRNTYGLFPKNISFDKTGHPLCQAGHKMCPWGNDPVKNAHKYRCPLKCGRTASCPYAEKCSPGSYGRTVYIKKNSDLRFQPRIPRDSEQYKTIYSERTACERANNRVLNDYCLQHLKIRGREHFSFWTMLAGICIHLDARYKAAHLYTALSQNNVNSLVKKKAFLTGLIVMPFFLTTILK